jgi:hypothetical protein
MGGEIAIVLRTKDQEFRMIRNVNILSYYLNHIGLYEERKDHIEMFLAYWKEVENDFCKHKNDKDYEFYDTEMKIRYAGLCPHDYGLIIIDQIHKVILDCFQDYTSIGELYAGYYYTHSGSFKLAYDKDVVEQYKEIIDKKKIKRFYKRKDNLQIEIPKTVEEFDKFFEQKKDTVDTMLELDTQPYSIERFNDDQDKQAYKRIKQLGFKMSWKEKRIWREYFREMHREVKHYHKTKSKKIKN